LAEQLGVSRQIVVGDVALLRAGGFAIDATPRGYRVRGAAQGYTGMLACAHSTEDALRQELYLVVDNGGTVEDVAVENPLYGELRATLHITSRYDADIFLRRAASQPQGLLSRMTGGVHLHTILCESPEAFARIRAALDAAGILYQK
jgi:transcriptional regulator of NAD metabolism